MTRKKTSCFLLLVVLTVWNRHPVVAMLNADDFIKDIKNIANNGLGVSSMQYYIDTQVSFISTAIQGDAIVEKLKRTLSETFRERFQLVWDLKATIEREWSTLPTTSPYWSCCDSQWDLYTSYDAHFKSKVDESRLCYRKSALASPSPRYANQAILQQFQDNANRVHGVRWQYYGTVDGLLFTYPAQQAYECFKNDPRFRPWYVETAAPVLKDVVIVIDTSGSMAIKLHSSETLMEIAKEATKTVVETLSTKDRIAVVELNTFPRVVAVGSIDSAESELVQATTAHKKILIDAIYMLQANGGTYYGRAMEKAFQLHNGTRIDPHNSNRRQVILFLSDGDPLDYRSAVRVITAMNTAMGGDISVLTYGIGQVSDYGKGVLQEMTTTSQNKPGFFKMIMDPTDLRGEMAAYYDFFSDNQTRTTVIPIVSAPYLDDLGLGMVATVSLPLYHGTDFVGVAAVDIDIADLFSPVSYMGEGACTYAFIVEQTGLTLTHPLLPKPNALTGEPVYLTIDALETGANVSDVIASMLRGESGRQAGLESSTHSNTYSYVDGVQYRCTLSEYFWENVTGTTFSVGVVVGDNDKTLKVLLGAPVQNVSFTYHELGLNGELGLCKHFSRSAVKDTTAVKLGATAFTRPVEYLDHDETEEDIERYVDFIYGRTADTVLKDQVREHVVISSKCYGFWFTGTKSTAEYSVWRYIAMSSGVIRINPGISLNKNYDPTTRPWYARAMQWKMKMTLSPPYLDAFGAGYVTTLSQALLEGRLSRVHSPADRVIGVMGMDITVSYLYNLLEERYPACRETEKNRCFVMNWAGYLIVHTDFVRSGGGESPLVENVHITVKEAAVAYSLINNNIMQRQKCTNIYDIREEEYYEVVINGTLDHMTGTPAFLLDPILETNIILGVVIVDNMSPRCVCSDPSSIEPTKCVIPMEACECPCYREGQFEYCEKTFTSKSKICLQKTAQLNVTADLLQDRDKIGDLDHCFDPKCKERTKSGCFSTAGCSWCERAEHGEHLEEPYCDDQEACYFGQEGYESPYADMFHSGPQEPQAPMSGGLIGFLVGFFVTAAVVAAFVATCVAKKWFPQLFGKRRHRTHPDPQGHTPSPNPRYSSSQEAPEETASNITLQDSDETEQQDWPQPSF